MLNWLFGRRAKESTKTNLHEEIERSNTHQIDQTAAVQRHPEPNECTFRGVVVPVIKDVDEFARIVPEKGTPLGLLVGMDDFTVTYGQLLASVPDSMTLPLSSNPFKVDTENGPCWLVCAGCEMVLPGSFTFGLSAAKN
jgi:hypothetical protein